MNPNAPNNGLDAVRLQGNVNAIVKQRDDAMAEVIALHGDVAVTRNALAEAQKQIEELTARLPKPVEAAANAPGV